jgi:hypothetical protein
MARARFKFERPAEIEGSITFTMTMKEWEGLRDKLDAVPGNYEINQVKHAVNDLLSQARKIVWHEPDAEAVS